MPEVKAIGTAFLVGMVLMMPLIVWVAWQMWPERVCIRAGQIVRSQRRCRESMPLSEVARVNFHYHAVVGFIGVWEFVAESGITLHISGDAKGIDHVISALEHFLPGFSKARFDEQFRDGDVEDSLEVWTRHP